MINRMILAVAAAAAVLVPTMAGAQVIRQFTRKDLTIQVDPTLSYIFYRTQAQAPMIFIRTPDEADYAAYRAARATALEKALKKYEKAARTYESEKRNWDDAPANQRAALVNPGKPPVKPTDENLAFPTIEMMGMTELGASPAFFKEKPIFGYLAAVKPGVYSVYGSVIVGPNGFAGICLCMGTLKFEAKAGEIVDLGIFAVQGVEIGARPPAVVPYGHPLPTEIRPFAGGLPARLQGLPVSPVAFQAAGKFPNYFGVTIDRIAPMTGVVSFRRDTIVDERTGQPLARQNGTAD